MILTQYSAQNVVGLALQSNVSEKMDDSNAQSALRRLNIWTRLLFDDNVDSIDGRGRQRNWRLRIRAGPT